MLYIKLLGLKKERKNSTIIKKRKLCKFKFILTINIQKKHRTQHSPQFQTSTRSLKQIPHIRNYSVGLPHYQYYTVLLFLKVFSCLVLVVNLAFNGWVISNPVCVYLYVCAHECRCPQRWERLDPSVAGVIGSWDLPDMVV